MVFLVLLTLLKAMEVSVAQCPIPTSPCTSISAFCDSILLSVLAAQPPGRHWPLRSYRLQKEQTMNLLCMLWHFYMTPCAYLDRSSLLSDSSNKSEDGHKCAVTDQEYQDPALYEIYQGLPAIR
jgi:hypothetical protein